MQREKSIQLAQETLQAARGHGERRGIHISMDLDITGILKDWPYEPGHAKVRRIIGEDGRERIQLRLDLGLLQMERTGRPDGQRPHGCESLLAYHQRRLAEHVNELGTEEGFRLDKRTCDLLRAEGVMYYHRYLASLILEDYEAVERDTDRNLRLFDFCKQYARGRSDRSALEQNRPYVLMIRARARGQRLLRDGAARRALSAVREGIREILRSYRDIGQEQLAEESTELAGLRAMMKDIRGKIPVDPVRHLRRELARAVSEERYEEAADLRDRIRQAATGADS